MICVRPSNERGRTELDWLDSRHTFSFGDYHDPEQMHFRSLRVINEDWVAPASGFPPHPHRDMEIVTYLLAGELAHQDSMGNGSTIRPGEVQRMSAGVGVVHSEVNPSKEEKVHLLQIWLRPAQRGGTPGYEQRAFSVAERQGRLRLVGSRDGRDGSVTIRQDVDLHATLLAPRKSAVLPLRSGRHAWVQVARGELLVNGTKLAAGDGAALSDEKVVELAGVSDCEALLFDLA